MGKIVLEIVVMLFIASILNYSYAYSDISENHWAYEAINDLTEKKILSGYPDGSFKPESNISRAEFITLILHIVEPNADVSSNTGYWADASIRLAEEKEIIRQGEYNHADFDMDITRREICIMIYRSFKGLENVDINKLTNKKQFLDIDKKNKEEEKIIAVLSHIGVLNGYPDNTVKLDSFSSRAETCCFIDNLIESRYILLSMIKDNELVLYEDDIAIVNKKSLPSELRKWKYSEDIPYVTTIIKSVDIFPFNEPIDKYKEVFYRINNLDDKYLEYRRKFGKNNFVIAVEFETINNTNNYETYAGSEFLHISFPEEEISIIDIFDTDEMNRQLIKKADIGRFINPTESWNTSAFYIVNIVPKNKIRFDRTITELYDKEKKQNVSATSFHSLIINLGG